MGQSVHADARQLPGECTSRGTPGGFDLTAVSRVFQAYEDIKTDRNVIDFEDVLLITVGILQEDPKVAATVREQYRHFVVDEYQDVSPPATAAFGFVARWPERVVRGGRCQPNHLLLHRRLTQASPRVQRAVPPRSDRRQAHS